MVSVSISSMVLNGSIIIIIDFILIVIFGHELSNDVNAAHATLYEQEQVASSSRSLLWNNM